MAYSRWIGSRWFTYWAEPDDGPENRDTALFEICGVATFTAAELRAHLQACVDKAAQIEELRSGETIDVRERSELIECMREFLDEVDTLYPKETKPCDKCD